MITLHKLNGAEVVVNAELIESVESTPDTVINLATGNRFVVKDGIKEVIEKVIEYRTRVYSKKAVIDPLKDFEKK